MHRYSLWILPLLAACPVAEPVTSIDGLAGGTLTGDVVAPAVTAASLTTKSLAVTGDVSAEGITAQSLDVTGDVTAENVAAEKVTTNKLIHRGFSLFGAPVGTITYDGDADVRGYRAVDGSCRAAYGEEAHVCSAEEAMTAYRSGVDPDASFSGAAVNSNGFYTSVRTYSGDEQLDTYLVVDDCLGWTASGPLAMTGGFSPTGGALENSWRIQHTYISFVHDEGLDVWRVEPLYNGDNCNSAVLLCCG